MDHDEYVTREHLNRAGHGGGFVILGAVGLAFWIGILIGGWML